jgi:hypothetical protein
MVNDYRLSIICGKKILLILQLHTVLPVESINMRDHIFIMGPSPVLDVMEDNAWYTTGAVGILRATERRPAYHP